jgi:hypothetical protein
MAKQREDRKSALDKIVGSFVFKLVNAIALLALILLIFVTTKPSMGSTGAFILFIKTLASIGVVTFLIMTVGGVVLKNIQRNRAVVKQESNGEANDRDE